jgi:hypothetical protein
MEYSDTYILKLSRRSEVLMEVTDFEDVMPSSLMHLMLLLCLLALLFDHKYGSITILRNVGKIQTKYTAAFLRRHHSVFLQNR